MNLLRRLCALHDRVTRWGFAAGAATLGGMALGSCYEVAARYLFAAPTTWAYDLTGYLLCVVIFLSAPLLTLKGEHVAIMLLPDVSPRRVRVLLDVCCQLAGLLACSFVAYVAFGEAMRQFTGGILTQAVSPIPKWLVSSFIVYGMASAALHFLRHLLAALRGRAMREYGYR